jgi:hypothetical protein
VIWSRAKVTEQRASGGTVESEFFLSESRTSLIDETWRDSSKVPWKLLAKFGCLTHKNIKVIERVVISQTLTFIYAKQQNLVNCLPWDPTRILPNPCLHSSYFVRNKKMGRFGGTVSWSRRKVNERPEAPWNPFFFSECRRSRAMEHGSIL